MKIQIHVIKVIKEKTYILLLDKTEWCWQSECDSTGNNQPSFKRTVRHILCILVQIHISGGDTLFHNCCIELLDHHQNMEINTISEKADGK